MRDVIDQMIDLESELRNILRAHGVEASLAVHDAAKRLIRMGFREAAPPELMTCKGNARVHGCGQMAVTSQGVCLNCLTRFQRERSQSSQRETTP